MLFSFITKNSNRLSKLILFSILASILVGCIQEAFYDTGNDSVSDAGSDSVSDEGNETAARCSESDLNREFKGTEYSIGDTGPAGGIVFYKNTCWYADGWRYLEAAPNDVLVGDSDDRHTWGGYHHEVGTTLADIGTGYENTRDIVESYGATDPYYGDSNYIARLCWDYEFGGADDWFLPSKDELNELYLQKDVVGGFDLFLYWSSTELDSDVVYDQAFTQGQSNTSTKTYYGPARPIRRF